jgi:hypothetical protein
MVTKESLRVNILLRAQNRLDTVHLLKANLLTFTGTGAAKSVNFTELIVPTEEVLAYHLAPSAHEPVDYDESEENRVMEPVSVLVGMFRFDGSVRLASQNDVATSLSTSQSRWLSLYNLAISSPHLSSIGVIKTPMALVRGSKVLFGLETQSEQAP